MTTVATHQVVYSPIDGEPLKQMMEGQKAAILYSDPPWDDANAERLQCLKWHEFMRQFVAVIRDYVDGWVFVEMGQRHIDDAAEMLCDVCPHVHVFPATWGSSRAWLLAGHTRMPVSGRVSLPPDCLKGGAKQVAGVVRTVCAPGNILLDPCAMNDHTVKAAIDCKMIFHGASTHRVDAIRRVLDR